MKLTDVCEKRGKRDYMCMSSTSTNLTDYFLREQNCDLNKTWRELNDYSLTDSECPQNTPSQSDPLLSFPKVLGGASCFVPKLYTTSDKEGRAKPSLCSKTHTISPPLSEFRPPSTVLLVDGVWLVPKLHTGLHFQWEHKQRETRSERKMMESVYLCGKHIW